MRRRTIRDARARREAIARLIRTRSIATQEELVELVAKDGFATTQATLSRDLAALGASRELRPEGGSFYRLRDDAVGSDHVVQLRRLGTLVTDVEENGLLVVVRTQPGAASTIAHAVDVARVPSSIGSVAGDDTIFVAPKRGKPTRALARQLSELFGIHEEER